MSVLIFNFTEYWITFWIAVSSVNKYLFTSQYVPDTILGAVYNNNEQSRQNFLPSEDYIEVGGDRQNWKCLKKI